MKFTKLLKYDLKNGFKQNSIKVLFFLFTIATILCVDFYLTKQKTYLLDGEVPIATFLDYACYLFGGMAEFIPALGESFEFPVRWFLLNLILFYGTLHYPVRDLFSLGINILPRSEKRILWWFSKCVWIIIYTVFSYLIIYGAILLFCVFSSEDISFLITPDFLNRIMDARTTFQEFDNSVIYAILILPLIITIGLNMIQMLLSLFLKPLLSYLVIIVFCLAGTYFNTGIIWSNYAMSLRSAFVVFDGYSLNVGIVLGVTIIIATMVIGGLIFRKINILEKDENY